MPRLPSMCLLLFALSTNTAFGELIHQYTFNDGTAADSVGGAHGVAVNNPNFVNGQVVFSPTTNNGTNNDPVTGQYIDLPNGIAEHRALTVEVWTTFRGGDPWQRVLDFGNSTAGELLPGDTSATGYDGHGFLILTQNGINNLLGQISIDSWGDPSDTDYSAASSGMSLNVEHHIVFTHDRVSRQQVLYLDGVQIADDIASVDPSTSNWTNYFIGRSNFYDDPFYNGSVNEVRLYDHAISSADVGNNHAAGPQAIPEPTTLVLLLAGFGSLGVIALRRRHGHDARP